MAATDKKPSDHRDWDKNKGNEKKSDDGTDDFGKSTTATMKGAGIAGNGKVGTPKLDEGHSTRTTGAPRTKS